MRNEGVRNEGVAGVDGSMGLARLTGARASTAAGRLTLLVLAGGLIACGGSKSATPSTPTPTAPTLQSIALSPDSVTIATGTQQQIAATGTYSDGKTAPLTSGVTWSSSDPSLATVDGDGVVTGVAASAGTATITASTGGVSGRSSLAITTSALQSVTVSPSGASLAAGLDQQLVATGHYADGTIATLGSGVTWSSSSGALATVGTSSGFVHAVATGPAVTITATDTASGLSGSASLTVTPAVLRSVTVSPSAASIAVLVDQKFTATGHYSDGTTALLPLAAWSSSSDLVASVDSAIGLAHGVATGGPITLTATDAASGLSGTASLTVTAPVLQSLTVSPATASIAVGSAQQFTATGHYSNGTSPALAGTVTWSSSNGAVATVDASSGLALALGVATGGPVTITATDASGLSATASLAVTAPVAVGALPGSQVPFSRVVDPGGISRFTVSGLEPGVDYLAVLRPPLDQSILLAVYGDATFLARRCNSWAGGAPCPVVASPAGEVFVIVSGAAGASFTLDVPLRPVLDARVDFPLAGSVATQAFYRVVGLTPGALFEARLEALSDDADIIVTDGPGPSALVICAGDFYSFSAHPERCLGTVPATGAVHVRVDGTHSRSGAAFTMAVVEVTPVPLDASLAFPGGLPFTVGTGSLHDAVTGLTPGKSYAVSLTGLAAGVDLQVYGDPYFGTKLCESLFSYGDLAESCPAVATATGLHLLVDGFFGAGTPFTLTVAAR